MRWVRHSVLVRWWIFIILERPPYQCTILKEGVTAVAGIQSLLYNSGKLSVFRGTLAPAYIDYVSRNKLPRDFLI